MDWNRLYEWQNVGIGVVGIASTVAFADPGVHVLVVGPVRLDAFYVPLVCFGIVLALSVSRVVDS
ncbi:hypothetical protein [Haloarcula nitratireducens]|uniref:Uncharacterized protein n=1 Tax=Haloarcula nitratireducens TaxID=2487749 RepID=A0AAW4PCH0_9EURY|nr:hypothetical protein [Halomicroarcula nitratireducens]MBX0295667.1 hypothetical protein [Halomicroarcula nitratireducens]